MKSIYIDEGQLSWLILVFFNINDIYPKNKLTVSWTNCLPDDAICYNRIFK